MSNDKKDKSAKPGRAYLLVALAFFLICVGNIVIGKIAVMQGAATIPGLGDVGEFLALFVANVFFIAACLKREKAQIAESG
ncbi:MAG: hypothetical protein AAF530_22295 [Pseudomonadota bacterium]